MHKQEHILIELKNKFCKQILDYLPFPKPYPENIKSSKAILLGCDPTNTKKNYRFEYVFGLGNDKDLEGRSIATFKNWFLPKWEKSLGEINLSFEDIYTQNLCRNYFLNETKDNPVWDDAAEYWIKFLKEELNKFDKKIPVLLTSERIYKVLLNPDEKKEKASFIYNNPKEIPITGERNKLDRPLIPFYRHSEYSITLEKWEPYKQRIIEILKNINKLIL